MMPLLTTLNTWSLLEMLRPLPTRLPAGSAPLHAKLASGKVLVWISGVPYYRGAE